MRYEKHSGGYLSRGVGTSGNKPAGGRTTNGDKPDVNQERRDV